MHAAIYSKIIKGSVKNSEFYITISLEELHIYTSIFFKKKEHVQTDSVFITHIRTKWAKNTSFFSFSFLMKKIDVNYWLQLTTDQS